jgi:hypothetical protein
MSKVRERNLRGDNLFECCLRKGRRGMVFALAVLFTIGVAACGTYSETECPSKDLKIVALYEANNRLNRAFVHHDWDWIYGKLIEGYRAGVCPKPEMYSTFLSRQKAGMSAYAIYNLRMISYNMYGDTAETKNYITTRLVMQPFTASPDTSFHYWIYGKGEWYLFDWDGRNVPVEDVSPETKELMKKLYPEDSARSR